MSIRPLYLIIATTAERENELGVLDSLFCIVTAENVCAWVGAVVFLPTCDGTDDFNGGDEGDDDVVEEMLEEEFVDDKGDDGDDTSGDWLAPGQITRMTATPTLLLHPDYLLL